MNKIVVHPIDVLMFRSRRPFYAGEHPLAKRGLISPLTFTGAIKAQIIRENWPDLPSSWWKKEAYDEVRELVGGPNKQGNHWTTGEINVHGIFFSKQAKKEFVPMPADVKKVEDTDQDFTLVSPIESEKVSLGGTYPSLSKERYYVEDDTKKYLTWQGFKTYLHGKELTSDQFISSEKLFGFERRFGIALQEDSKLTKEGFLYSADFLRLTENTRFSVWIKNHVKDYLSSKGILKLGGENRMVRYHTEERQLLEFQNLIDTINQKGKFKLYLTSPSIFESVKPHQESINEGEMIKMQETTTWRPNIEKLQRLLNLSKPPKLISATLSDPHFIGGWNMAKNKQKPLKKAVGKGSVYFFKLQEGTQIPHNISIPFSISDDYAHSGLGLCFLARWK